MQFQFDSAKMSFTTEETTTLTDSSEQQDVIVFPEAAMIFAAVCASIFTVVGVGGK